MKHLLAVLLCLALCGCTPTDKTIPSETAPETQAAPILRGLYDPDHPMEKAHPGEIRAYPLTKPDIRDMRAIGTDLLILSGDKRTTLTVLSGDNLYEKASRMLDFELDSEDPSLQIHDDGISYFDPHRQETILLDGQLQEIRRITSPQNLSGSPLLSSDTRTLYYCTAWSVMAWDLDSGIRRTVKEISYSNQHLKALRYNDQILECSITDGSNTSLLLLSARNGTESARLPQDVQIKTGPSGYFSAYPHGFQELLIFGSSSAASLLLPKTTPDQTLYLEHSHAAVTVNHSGSDIRLDYYELHTGQFYRSLTLDKTQSLKNIVNTADQAVYILAQDPSGDYDTIYRWSIPQEKTGLQTGEVYTFPYSDPGPEDWENCAALAHRIGEKYGITVLFGESACEIQPWDYQLTTESVLPILERELMLLEQRLSQYPAEILQQTISHFTGVTVCIVRDIAGTSEADSLASATGIQFLEGDHAYIVITSGRYSEQALYHEFYHVMETHILTETTTLDLWEALNPGGFSYSKEEVPSAEFDIYLQGQTRAFSDRYSMRYPREDRARILENAMLQGKKDLFQSEYMQQKLITLCQGIRDAYSLQKLKDALPWEQYLVTPLTAKQ